MGGDDTQNQSSDWCKSVIWSLDGGDWVCSDTYLSFVVVRKEDVVDEKKP